MGLPANHTQAALSQSSMTSDNHDCENTGTNNAKPDAHDFFFTFYNISFVPNIKKNGVRFEVKLPRRVLTDMRRKEFSCGQHLFIKFLRE